MVARNASIFFCSLSVCVYWLNLWCCYIVQFTSYSVTTCPRINMFKVNKHVLSANFNSFEKMENSEYRRTLKINLPWRIFSKTCSSHTWDSESVWYGRNRQPWPTTTATWRLNLGLEKQHNHKRFVRISNQKFHIKETITFI